MTDCPACQQSLCNPHHGIVLKACCDCLARDLAKGPDAWQSRKEGAATVKLKKLVRRVFGDDWKAWMPRVKFWGERCK